MLLTTPVLSSHLLLNQRYLANAKPWVRNLGMNSAVEVRCKYVEGEPVGLVLAMMGSLAEAYTPL